MAAVVALTLLCVAARVSAQDSAVRYAITEGLQTRGDVIGDLVREAPGFNSIHRNDSAIIARLKYTFLPGSSVHAAHFYVQNGTGLLRVARAVDRDAICPRAELCRLSLNVRVEPPYFHIIRVDVTVRDVNDEQPKFPSAEIFKSISEASVPGASFTVPPATDNDSPRYSVQQYRLVSGTDKFRLKVEQNADGTADIHLVLRERVDREQRSAYDCQIRAVDGGQPPLTGQTTVKVSISDVNDVSPAFENDTYEVTIDENTDEHTSVIRVVAHDDDVGVNGKITYSLDDNSAGAFRINSSTGDVFVQRRLRYQDHSVYRLTVVARDHGDGSLPARAKLTIHIRDVNDNPPRISVHNAVGGAVWVSEHTRPGQFVTHFSVFDADGGRNGQFSCTLVGSGGLFSLSRLYPTEFKVLAVTAFDREAQASYDTAIVCTDQGVPQLSSTQVLRINIKDENDRSPIFTQDVYSVTVLENVPARHVVTAVRAEDADEGDNAVVRYTLREQNRYLQVDSVSGNITAKVTLDHEEVKVITLHVIATDQGKPQRSSETEVKVTVLDVDDEAPKFKQRSYSLGVFENEAPQTYVGQVIAEDKDDHPYDKFTYHLLDSDVSLYFRVDPNDGKVYTKHSLDREAKEQYEFVVRTMSQTGEAQKQDEATVTVTVTDRNDHAPLITYPSAYNNTLHVWSHVTAGGHVTMVQATDPDKGENSRLAYTIASGNEDGVFQLDAFTGQVTVASPLTSHIDRAFGLVIRVTDHGDVPKRAEAIMNIIVNRSEETAAAEGALQTNWAVVISVACVSGVVIVVLIIAIVIVIRNQRRHDRSDVIKAPRLDLAPSEVEQGDEEGRGAGFYPGGGVYNPAELKTPPDGELQRPADGLLSGASHGSNHGDGRPLLPGAREPAPPSATVKPFLRAPRGTYLTDTSVLRDYSVYQTNRLSLGAQQLTAHAPQLTAHASFMVPRQPAPAFGKSASYRDLAGRPSQPRRPAPDPAHPRREEEGDSLSNTDSGRGSNDDTSDQRGPDSPSVQQPRHDRRWVLLEPQLLDEKRRVLYQDLQRPPQPALSSHV